MPPASDERRAVILPALAVALVAVILYTPTLGHGFAFDDAQEVVRNDHIRSLSNLRSMFAGGAWEGAGQENPIYRPLTTLTYAVNHAVHGLAPFGYHLGNVLLHALVSALVLVVGVRAGLSRSTAAVAALVFAVHPVHVEAVANVAGRKDVLVTLFVLLSVLAHDTAMRRRGAFVAVPPLVLAAAFFSKESGLAALAILPAWDLLLRRKTFSGRRRRAVTLYAGYGSLALLYLAVRTAAVGSLGVPVAFIPFVENPLAFASAGERVLTSVAVLGKGLALLVLPVTLAPDYSFEAIPVATSILDPRFAVSAALLVVLTIVALRHWRSHPIWLFCAIGYGAAIFPASNLAVPVGTIFGERLLYLPSVAFCLAVGSLAGLLMAKRRRHSVVLAATGVVLILFSVRTWTYASVWSNELSLFEAAVRAEPASAKARELLGSAYMEVGRGEDGAREFQRALRILERARIPSHETRVKLGVALERVGRLVEAEEEYRRILAKDPDYADALWRLGVVRWMQGRRDEATALWERTLLVAPGHARAMSDLGIAVMDRGDVARAEALWLRAAELDPRAAGPWLSLGALYDRRGDPDRARAAWERFLDRARYGAYVRERKEIEERLRRSTVK